MELTEALPSLSPLLLTILTHLILLLISCYHYQQLFINHTANLIPFLQISKNEPQSFRILCHLSPFISTTDCMLHFRLSNIQYSNVFVEPAIMTLMSLFLYLNWKFIRQCLLLLITLKWNPWWRLFTFHFEFTTICFSGEEGSPALISVLNSLSDGNFLMTGHIELFKKHLTVSSLRLCTKGS